MTELALPAHVIHTIDTLNGAGYLAFAVGGGVRDLIIGTAPSDWDVATSARPDQIKSVFERTADTGVKYGTVTVLYGRQKVEVTTFRTEESYIDHRRPSQVGFSDSLYTDLKRRDFTINAIAYHPRLGIIDPFGGIDDIKGRLIRAVGTPEDRFSEDALRIMRAYRFKAQLGFEIEPQTHMAAKAASHLLCGISRERIWQELSKTLLSPNPDVVFEMVQELRDYTISKIKYGGFSLKSLPGLTYARLAGALLQYYHERGDIEAFMRELKIDNRTGYSTNAIIKASTEQMPLTRADIKRKMAEYSAELFKIGVKLAELYRNTDLSWISAQVDEIIALNECYRIRDLDITGDDLINSGLAQGKDIGKALRYLLNLVIEDPALNSKPVLLHLLQRRP